MYFHVTFSALQAITIALCIDKKSTFNILIFFAAIFLAGNLNYETHAQ